MTDSNSLLTIKEVAQITRLSKPTIYKLIKEGLFPKQLRLGANKVAWLQSEIDGWVQERADERGEEQ